MKIELYDILNRLSDGAPEFEFLRALHLKTECFGNKVDFDTVAENIERFYNKLSARGLANLINPSTDLYIYKYMLLHGGDVAVCALKDFASHNTEIQKAFVKEKRSMKIKVCKNPQNDLSRLEELVWLI